MSVATATVLLVPVGAGWEVGAVPLKVSEMIKIIEADGWYLERVTGSHTIAGKPSDTLPPGTEKSILRQAGIEWRRR